jgi:hypothetical protein
VRDQAQSDSMKPVADQVYMEWCQVTPMRQCHQAKPAHETL